MPRLPEFLKGFFGYIAAHNAVWWPKHIPVFIVTNMKMSRQNLFQRLFRDGELGFKRFHLRPTRQGFSHPRIMLPLLNPIFQFRFQAVALGFERFDKALKTSLARSGRSFLFPPCLPPIQPHNRVPEVRVRCLVVNDFIASVTWKLNDPERYVHPVVLAPKERIGGSLKL